MSLLKASQFWIFPENFFSIRPLRDHPLKTSAFFRGVGVKNSENLPTSLMDGPLKAEWNAAAMQCFYCFNMLLRGKRIFFVAFKTSKDPLLKVVQTSEV